MRLTFQLPAHVHLLGALLRPEVVEVQLVDLQPQLGRLLRRGQLQQLLLLLDEQLLLLLVQGQVGEDEGMLLLLLLLLLLQLEMVVVVVVLLRLEAVVEEVRGGHHLAGWKTVELSLSWTLLSR